MKAIELNLRSRHIAFLNLLSKRDGVSLAASFRALVDKHSETDTVASTSRPANKYPLAVYLREDQIDSLDAQAVLLGVWRADIARRLIDAAIVKEEAAKPAAS